MNFTLKGPRQRFIALLGAAVAAASVVGVATADDISNNIDGSVDAVAEVMPLNVGGANGTTQLYVVPQNDDGKNGCNLTRGTTLTLAVSSSNEAVATVSPSSVTFTSCGATPTLTVTPHSAGSATISVAQTLNNTGGTFNLAPATFTVNVTAAAPANTAPTVAVAGVTGGASYDKDSVPGATCNVTDAEDGNSSFAATLSSVTGPYASDGIGSQTATCSYTDRGGLTAVDSKTYNIIDPSPPAISYALSPTSPNGANGWYKTNVGIDWTVAEPESPNSLQTSADCDDQTITAEGTTSLSCSASSAGGSSGPVNVSIKKDATAPVVRVTGVAHGATYPLGSVPAAGCTTTDATSGVATSATLSTSGGPVGSVTATCSGALDNAGNTGSASATYSVHYNWTGFFQPIDNGVLNVAKAGSAIPVKFSLAGDQGLGIFQSGSPLSAKVPCDASMPEDSIEATVTAGSSSLSYDPLSDQYNYVWKTDKAWAGTCRKLTVTLIDGTPHTANFKLTK